MKQSDLISIRELHDADHAFIFSTWLRNLWYAEPKGSKNDFMQSKHQEIDEILRTGRVWVATLKDDPDVILGYAVFQDDKPVWAYVKKSWRGIGIAKQLLNRKEKP